MRLVFIFIFLLSFCGCAEPSKIQPYWYRPADITLQTPLGVSVIIPFWFPADEKRMEAFAEIDIAFLVLGINPAELTVQVTVPIYEAPYSPTGLARGEYRANENLVVVGWKYPGEKLYFPALIHELEHHLYGPDYGH